MKVWETFKDGSRLYRQHFGQLFVLNAITFMPAAIIAFAVSREAMPIGNSQAAIDRWMLLTGAMIALMMLWGLVSTATLHYAVGDAYQSGTCDWRDSLRRCRPRLVVFAGTMAAIGLVVAVAGGLVALLTALNQAIGLVALVVMMLAGAFVGSSFITMLVPVVVREDVGVREAFERTWELIRPKLLLLLGLLIATGFIVGVCNRLMGGAIEAGFAATVSEPTQMLIAVFASIVVPTLVFTPWSVAVITVAYIRLREERGENIDGSAPPGRGPVPGGPPLGGNASTPSIAAPVLSRVPAPIAPTAAATFDDDVAALLDLDAPVPTGTGRPRWSEPLGGD